MKNFFRVLLGCFCIAFAYFIFKIGTADDSYSLETTVKNQSNQTYRIRFRRTTQRRSAEVLAQVPARRSVTLESVALRESDFPVKLELYRLPSRVLIAEKTVLLGEFDTKVELTIRPD